MNELLERGVEKIFPSIDFVRRAVEGGKKLRVYLGVDPTGPTLHIGHLIPLLKLRDFQRAGHQVVFLIGDFTATIGDPTDKLAARTQLSPKEVLENAKLYKKQAGKIISFEGENAAELRYNTEWLAPLSFADGLSLAARLTHAELIKRDMFQKRIAGGSELYMHEVLYPLLQGYDSVALEVDGEVGGNDQTYNMLVGRDLAKKISGKEKFVIAMKLLAGAGGTKMGKTEGNMVAFSDTPLDAFGKVMSWPDTLVECAFELCTRVPMEDIPCEGNPKDAKMRLAYEIIALVHGEGAAVEAERKWTAAFSQGVPQEFVEIQSVGAIEALLERGIIESKSDLRRLIAEGAVTAVESGEKQKEDFLKNPPLGKYRIGKHRFVSIV